MSLDPTEGGEMQKTRPCLVVSAPGLQKLGVRVVLPITGWKATSMERPPWFVRVEASDRNGLSKTSAVACHHIRSVDLRRFVRRLGRIEAGVADEVNAALVITLNIE